MHDIGEIFLRKIKAKVGAPYRFMFCYKIATIFFLTKAAKQKKKLLTIKTLQPLGLSCHYNFDQ